MTQMRTVLAFLIAASFATGGCTYLRYASVHAEYERARADQPTQWLEKHSFKSDTYFVYGQLLSEDWPNATRHSLAVVAASSRFRPDEVVEVNQLGQARSYYGLNLPAGDYRLLVLADVDEDGLFESSEIVGERDLTLASRAPSDRVLGGLDIDIAPRAQTAAALAFRPISVTAQNARPSLFYPKGTLRTLDDPLFTPAMSQLGLYDPAAFIESAPMMFYALEEDLGHKVPVIFVHGIGGSPTEFRSLVERMDRTHYKPWFYFYPSGGDLVQLARLFRDIFLSGNLIPLGDTPIVIVAHSMGGLVVREALNQCEHGSCGNRVALLVTIATPFGGEPAARTGVARAPFVPDAWRGLDPQGTFVHDLFRNPLPDGTTHHLIYTYRNSPSVARGTDGVVPLSSQLAADARIEAAQIHGFKSGHTQVLHDPEPTARILDLVHGVRSNIPAEQLRLFEKGGFDVPLGTDYSELEKYVIRNLGLVLRALVNGEVRAAYPVQDQFIKAARGETAASNYVETAWLRFRAEYPELASARERP